jgi:hypothetical protein
MPPEREELDISRECLERLETWLLAHVRSALDDKEFVGGLLFIVNEEVKDALRRGRTEAMARMQHPQPQ